MILIPIVVFCLGLIIGSFLNVVILRLNTGRSIAVGRSKCARCSKVLPWYELIPVFSFLALRGKCSSCKASISFQYPLVELVTAILFLMIYSSTILGYGFGLFNWITFVFSCVITALLIVITVYDFRHKIIPDKIVIPFIVLSFISIIWRALTIPSFSFINGIFAALLMAAPFFFLWYFSKGRFMGFGDVRLALGIGALVGLSASISVFVLSFWFGAVIGLILMATSKAYGLKSEIPFAPFMIAALFVVSILGVTIQSMFPIWQ